MNSLNYFMRDCIQDDILRKTCLHAVSKKPEASTGPTSSSHLLAAVDLDVIQALDTPSIRDVPGGTISFVFEKCSKTALDDIVDE